ncbi:mu-type opioid receptor-like [Saccostrea echinata]|uniref:mu-type opioid receptor-like n=1 Tax=Saccostrea echinata TaxID=191078 RepID=UPI002A815176|nr:mu-type opioid receptor-like [Saccostrea echinata]
MANPISEDSFGKKLINYLNLTQQSIGNESSFNSSSDLYFFTLYMYIYVQPILCVLGFLGNFISVFVFCSKPLRNASSNVYLTALSCTSFVFCLSNFLVWLETVRVQLFHQEVLCQAIIYITYVCSFLTVWYVVCITFENFVVTINLRYAVIVCTVYKARVIVTSLAVTAILLYSFALWTTKLQNENGMIYCAIGKDYHETLHVFTYIDIIITLAVPFIAMAFFLGAVYLKHIILRVPCSPGCKMAHPETHKHKSRGNRNESLTRITRVLLAIGSSYMVLSVPSCVNKIRSIVLSMKDQQETPSPDSWAIVQICQMIYYLSFCLNFAYYVKWSVNYRRALGNLFKIFLCNRISDNENNKCAQVPLINILSRKNVSQEIDQVATYV